MNNFIALRITPGSSAMHKILLCAWRRFTGWIALSQGFTLSEALTFPRPWTWKCKYYRIYTFFTFIALLVLTSTR